MALSSPISIFGNVCDIAKDHQLQPMHYRRCSRDIDLFPSRGQLPKPQSDFERKVSALTGVRGRSAPRLLRCNSLNSTLRTALARLHGHRLVSDWGI
jgi:hypothetical protein